MGYPVCLYGPVSYPKLRSGLTSIVTPTERNLRNSPENRVTRSAEKIVKHYTRKGRTNIGWIAIDLKANDWFEWTRFHAAKVRNV